MEKILRDAEQSIKYRDRWVRLLLPLPAAHYIMAINKPEPFLKFIQLSSYPLMLWQNWLLFFVILYSIYTNTSYLDIKYPWTSTPLHRTLLQLILGIIVPSFQALFLAYCFLRINGFNIFETGYLKLEWWFSILFIILLNFYYVLFYFIQVFLFLSKNAQASIKDAVVGNAAKVWLFTQGNEMVKIEEGNIAYFFRAGELCLAYTFDGEQYIVDKTLDEIVDEVERKQFFRINRSFIINYEAIVGYSPATSNRILLKLSFSNQKEFHVSQRNVREFREWFEKG